MSNKNMGERVAVLDLWDYYAAAALGGAMANPELAGRNSPQQFAQEAAFAADVMLAERAKRMEQNDE